MRITQSQLDMMNAGNEPTKVKRNKYNAKKETSGGVKYDSGREAGRGRELELQEHCGIISGLKKQVSFILQDRFTYEGEKIRQIKYIADFQYSKNGKIITEDSKGFRNSVYKIKRKMLLKRYPDINFIET